MKTHTLSHTVAMHPKTTKVNEAQVAYIFPLVLEGGVGPGPLGETACLSLGRRGSSFFATRGRHHPFNFSIATLGGAPSCFVELAAVWALFRP